MTSALAHSVAIGQESLLSARGFRHSCGKLKIHSRSG